MMKQIPLVGGMIIFLVATFFFVRVLVGQSPLSSRTLSENTAMVSVREGIQYVPIVAKGGYSPRTSFARAGLPTVLQFETRGTFDCSAAVIIPDLNIDRMLPPSGMTDIPLGVQKAGMLSGSCGMGMYPFEIEFR